MNYFAMLKFPWPSCAIPSWFWRQLFMPSIGNIFQKYSLFWRVVSPYRKFTGIEISVIIAVVKIEFVCSPLLGDLEIGNGR